MMRRLIPALLTVLLLAAPADAAEVDRILVEKARHVMVLMKDEVVVRSYQVSLGRGGPEPKQREGDLRVPEGVYKIAGRNPKSAYHLSLKISYPAPRDVEAARGRGVDPGGDIMIHGLRNGLGWLGALHRLTDWTAGCIAVTNSEIDEIWQLVPDGTPIEIRP